MAESQNAEATKQPAPERVERSRELGSEEPAVLLQRAVAPSFQGGRIDPRRLTPQAILALQRTVGNAAVNRLFTKAGTPAGQQVSGTSWVAPLSGTRQQVTIQRATVSGVTNPGRPAAQIGDDMHNLVQQHFLSSSLASNLRLGVEVQVGGLRADLVAEYKEMDDDGETVLGHQIYVGEIKPYGAVFQPGVRGAGPAQLQNYILAFRAAFPAAQVGILNFWDPDSDGMVIGQGGYNCFLYMRNAKNGMYYYQGRVTEQHSFAANNGDSDSDTEAPFI